MDKRIIKTFPNGQVVYDFNPSDAMPDAPNVNAGWRVVPKEKGLTIDTARAKAMKQAGTLSEKCGYKVYTPCVACANCFIVRELEHGEYQNTAYACRLLKRMVDRFGTCQHGETGRSGPLVIDHDKSLAEVEANMSNLIN